LPKVLDEIIESGGRFQILDFQIGVKHDDESFARIRVTADDEDELAAVVERLARHGASPETVEDAAVAVADVDGAFPAGFYSSTNLETEVRIDGRWLPVQHPEMDCGIVIESGVARTLPMSDVRAGMHLVMRGPGIRVIPLVKPEPARKTFEFMASDISSENPRRFWSSSLRDRCASSALPASASCGSQVRP
jgi:hypothetical protein